MHLQSVLLVAEKLKSCIIFSDQDLRQLEQSITFDDTLEKALKEAAIFHGNEKYSRY